MAKSVTRMVDSKGRVTLGKSFANKLVIVNEVPAGAILVRAEAVPAKEAWLHKNPRAIAAVVRGLAEAEAGEFAEAPDLEEGSALADAIEDA
ncbi:MAG: hypothetical protein AMJ81_07000 [Phycisphaerae bacterium SM23_33]|jgi:hypothetical protein|nr:MAG: hypothetical protein AMJ81_07000 [Phycisphaerae bacterium SM23_33]